MDGGCGAMCDKIGALVKTSTGSRNAVAFNGGGSSKATAASDSARLPARVPPGTRALATTGCMRYRREAFAPRRPLHGRLCEMHALQACQAGWNVRPHQCLHMVTMAAATVLEGGNAEL